MELGSHAMLLTGRYLREHRDRQYLIPIRIALRAGLWTIDNTRGRKKTQSTAVVTIPKYATLSVGKCLEVAGSFLPNGRNSGNFLPLKRFLELSDTDTCWEGVFSFQ